MEAEQSRSFEETDEQNIVEVYVDKSGAVRYWRRDGIVQMCTQREQECTGKCPYLQLQNDEFGHRSLIVLFCGNNPIHFSKHPTRWDGGKLSPPKLSIITIAD